MKKAKVTPRNCADGSTEHMAVAHARTNARERAKVHASLNTRGFRQPPFRPRKPKRRK
jgi:hypothetical protein